MSVYNGFSTRSQELVYAKALYNTLFLLQLRIYKLFKGGKLPWIMTSCRKIWWHQIRKSINQAVRSNVLNGGEQIPPS